jgi:3'(2'), 5'-bisphosphate nucleotidase
LSEGYKVDIGGPGSLVVAVRGQGAWTRPLDADGDFKQLGVSAQADPGQARLLRSAEAAHTNVDKLDDIAAQLGVAAEPVRMDSQAKYTVLAAGQGELLFRLLSPKMPDYREKLWDQAAGALIVEEAGGSITDLDGKPLDFSAGRVLVNNRGVLASNGRLHAAALEAVRAVGA